MLTPSADILPWLMAFAPALTRPTFRHLLVLFSGTVLAPGERTVTAALRVLGEVQGNFGKLHRFFNRAHWSPMLLSRLLLHLLLRTFLEAGTPVVIVVDETLERRRSRKIAYRGLFRDAVRSTAEGCQFAWGVRWVCFALLAPVPWSRRVWALPFLALPLLSEKACVRLGKPHRTLVEVVQLVLPHLRRWVPDRAMVLVGDGAYAALPLGATAQQLAQPVRLVTRVRLDAVLHDPPPSRPRGRRGVTPKKGPRQPKLRDRLEDPATPWQRVRVAWYGGTERILEIVTGTALWYRPGHDPLPVRWVLVRTQESEKGGSVEAGALICTDPEASPEQILSWFTQRWNIEITFAEVRAHLGFETQRHWSTRAVGRVIPCLLGCFSLVVVIARALHPRELPLTRTQWYRKEDASFSDALAAVRGYLWERLTPPLPTIGDIVDSPEVLVIPTSLWRQVRQVVCYAH